MVDDTPRRPIIAVCVPIRNEEHSVADLLTALATQAGVQAASVVHCFFLNGCTDRSADRIRAVADDHSLQVVIRSDPSLLPPNAGRARHHAVQLGIEALTGCPNGILLTTDGDCIPADDWLLRNCEALDRADVVAGNVEQMADGMSPAHERLRRYFDQLHRLRRRVDPVAWEASSTHHYTAGASLAFRKKQFEHLGGFSHQARGEDADFVTKARWLGLRVRHDAAVVVQTSTRRQGRVTGGFAEHLNTLDELGRVENLEVVDPQVALLQYRRHALARAMFRARSTEALKDLGSTIGVEYERISKVFANAPNDKAFAMRVVPMPSSSPPIKLAKAETALDCLSQTLLAA